MTKNPTDPAREFDAAKTIVTALADLSAEAQLRVLRFVAEALQLNAGTTYGRRMDEIGPSSEEAESETAPPATQSSVSPDEEGISVVALKWLRRSGLEAKSLRNLFSVGMDEIDLINKSVPGKTVRARMHNVLLLKAIAAYLGTGTARVTHEELKEACIHYNAYDGKNFASYMREFAPEVGGSRESGYSLTARGLTAATDLVKSIVGGQPEA